MKYYRLSFFDMVFVLATKGLWVLWILWRGDEITVPDEDDAK